MRVVRAKSISIEGARGTTVEKPRTLARMRVVREKSTGGGVPFCPHTHFLFPRTFPLSSHTERRVNSAQRKAWRACSDERPACALYTHLTACACVRVYVCVCVYVVCVAWCLWYVVCSCVVRNVCMCARMCACVRACVRAYARCRPSRPKTRRGTSLGASRARGSLAIGTLKCPLKCPLMMLSCPF